MQTRLQALRFKATTCRHSSKTRRCSVKVQAAAPVVMVNSCTGNMGKAVAEAATRAGLTVAPYTLCSESEAAEKKFLEVSGQQLQLVGPSSRDAVIEQVGGWCLGD